VIVTPRPPEFPRIALALLFQLESVRFQLQSHPGSWLFVAAAAKRQDSKTKAIENTNQRKTCKAIWEKSTTPVPPQGADSHHEGDKSRW